MKKCLLTPCVAIACLLAACAPQGSRMVNAVDSDAFTVMSCSLQGEMLRRHLVTAQGSWYSPVISLGPFFAGERLVNRLSPAFRYPKSNMALPATFRESLGEDAHVILQGPKAVIEQGLSRVELRLAAVADWNGDGQDDWLVLCRTGSSDEPRKYRDYYLAVLDLKSPVWKPEIILVMDHVYGKTRLVQDPSQGELAGSTATEYLQGQAVIIDPPSRSAAVRPGRQSSRLKKSSLNN